MNCLAEAAGLKAPTREEWIDFDRKRKPKKLSNKEWEHPVDPDARVAKMKDGATDMAHKAKCALRRYVMQGAQTLDSTWAQPGSAPHNGALSQSAEELHEVLPVAPRCARSGLAFVAPGDGLRLGLDIDLGIDVRGRQLGVAEPGADRVQVHPRPQQVRRRGMPDHMRAHDLTR